MCIALDIVSMPESKLFDGRTVDAAVVAVDRHSGWIDAWPVQKRGLTSKRVAQLMHERWLTVFGVPTEVCTDLGQHFAGAWFRTFCGLRGVMHAEAVSYRPSSNGRAEQAVGAVLDALRKLDGRRHADWPEGLPTALHNIRVAVGCCGLSPYQVVFGRDVLASGLPLPSVHEAEDAVQFHRRMEAVDRHVQQTLEDVHQRQQPSQPDEAVMFAVGQRVWVVRPDRHQKLASWWTGPHVVKRQVGRDVWMVDVGNKERAVHRQQMKAWVPTPVGRQWELHHHQLTEADGGDTSGMDEWNVERIIRHRRKADGSWEFLTRWEGYGEDDDCWEPASSFLQRVNLPWLRYCRQHGIDFKVMDHLKSLLRSDAQAESANH